MTATSALTTDLQRQVLLLEDDLRARVAADADLEGRWKQEHQRARDKERTAASWVAWRDDRVTQAAVAWVLTSVFIRFCEDNALVGPVWIAGPEHRRQEALDAQLAFFRTHPEDTDREWLQAAIDHLAGLPATKALVDTHSALHLVSPSGNAVTAVLDFWRRRSEDGALVHDLADSSLSTRFLGDLYQDLSQHAKDTYALLQTPVFVEEFILDRTLEPALKERPLEGFKLIDPACGSGHFLLGAFARLLDRWNRHAPGLETQARVQAALDAIHGVDLNPFAVAIARFRLMVVALQASGLTSLEAAPAFTFHLAVGDSLIHGPDPHVLPGMTDRSAFMPFMYATEDGPLLLTMLEESRYDVVVGNPPYITVKDKALNQIYRSKYSDVCKGKYALTVPFMKLFFALAKSGECAGWIGQITSNSFIKREFGTRLIEQYLPSKDLKLVADTSGAIIPGHSTGTVILVGRNAPPGSSSLRAVLRLRGEVEHNPTHKIGPYWQSLVEHIDQAGWTDEWLSVRDISRLLLAHHPWTLEGGGVQELKAKIEAAATNTLSDHSFRIGFFGIMGLDDSMITTWAAIKRQKLEEPAFRRLVLGDEVRDHGISDGDPAWFPYTESHQLIPIENYLISAKMLWRCRCALENRATFAGATYRSEGRPWYEWHQLPRDARTSPLTITYAFISTHNHFVLDREGKVFKQSAPVIKLPESATISEHLALLGVLNSSTVCFWLKQVCHSKGNATVSSGIADQPWSWNVEFSCTNVSEIPIPSVMPKRTGHLLDGLSQQLTSITPSAVCDIGVPTPAALNEARRQYAETRARMIALQEELDWNSYRSYGLIDEDMTYDVTDLPGLALGERAFEIALARALTSGKGETAWFERHGSTPITEIPVHWPPAYRELVRRRLDLIEGDPFIGLLEKPEYKRRWTQVGWEKRQEQALREWLLDRVEDRRFWFDSQGRPLPQSVSQLADDVGRDPELVSVLELWEGRPDVPVTKSLVRLLADEAVPFLAAYRYKDSGLRKREDWEETWRLQRLEDAGEKVEAMAMPPKYTSADFRKSSYWQARGKLDVPKERFILYPDAGRETDPTPLLGWAGWDHAQQSLALSLIIGDREKDGWDDDRLVSLVAGLAELQPWVEQWHGEVDPNYGVSLAAFCREQLIARAVQVGETLDGLAAWCPAPATRGRAASSTGTS